MIGSGTPSWRSSNAWVWRAFRAQARERPVGAMVIAGIVFAGGSMEGLNLLNLVVVVMFVVLVIEHRRIQRLRLHAELETERSPASDETG
jgi:hypothetical protein